MLFLFSSNHSQPKGKPSACWDRRLKEIKAKQGSKCGNYFLSKVQLIPGYDLDINLQILETKTIRKFIIQFYLHPNQRKIGAKVSRSSGSSKQLKLSTLQLSLFTLHFSFSAKNFFKANFH